MSQVQYFPTTFAKVVLQPTKLYPDGDVYDTTRDDADEAAELHGRLMEFQQLALFNDFDSCLVVYYDKELTEDQKAALVLIHASTKTWALGHVSTMLLSKLDDDGRNLIEVASTLIGQLGTKAGEPPVGSVKRYIVQLSRIDEKNGKKE